MGVYTCTRRQALVWAGTSVVAWKQLLAEVQQKSIDKRHASESGEYAIGFAAKAADEEFDHAFVVWYFSDSKGMRTVRRCAGFYPVSDRGTKAYDMILGVSGEVVNDSKTKISKEVSFLVNKDVFDQALLVEGAYKDAMTYRLALNDCTSFVEKVLATIPGVTVPSRAAHLYPSNYVAAIFAAN